MQLAGRSLLKGFRAPGSDANANQAPQVGTPLATNLEWRRVAHGVARAWKAAAPPALLAIGVLSVCAELCIWPRRRLQADSCAVVGAFARGPDPGGGWMARCVQGRGAAGAAAAQDSGRLMALLVPRDVAGAAATLQERGARCVAAPCLRRAATHCRAAYAHLWLHRRCAETCCSGLEPGDVEGEYSYAKEYTYELVAGNKKKVPEL